MSEAFLGEIRIMAFSYAPIGWALCSGSTMQIYQNQALFALLSTMYGGDGKTTFCLPDLRGRCINHVSSTYGQGLNTGVENYALTVSEMPAHSHPLMASTEAVDRAYPTDKLFGVTNANFYSDTTSGPLGALHLNTVVSAGVSAPHSNMMPSLVVNYCIAVTGIYPPRN